jgi:hypothetical protein
MGKLPTWYVPRSHGSAMILMWFSTGGCFRGRWG